jgi:hypothetical protein
MAFPTPEGPAMTTNTASPSPASGFTMRELTDELVRRFGHDDACQQLGVASMDELQKLFAEYYRDHPSPDVPLPAGATAEDDAWATWENESRIFRGPDRVVLNGAAEVRTCGVQYLDGSVDDGEDPPGVDICTFIDGDLRSEHVRKIAAVLIDAADEIDGWVNS